MTEPKSPLILTIDVGTSSTRAMLYDATARPVTNCLAQYSNDLTTTAEGRATFEPEEIVQGIAAVIDELLEQAGPLAAQIGGVSMDTLVSNALGVDADGKAVTPIYTYADTSNATDAQVLRLELGKEGMAEAHNRTGCLIHTSYLPARFRWLARTQPALFAACTQWMSIGEYVLQEFLGTTKVSYSVAAWTGLLNRHNLVWDESWLAQLPINANNLSPLGDVNEPLTGLREPWASRWPVLQAVPWFPAIGDGAAANIGSGCDNPRRVALTIGTTGAMRVVVDPKLEEVPDGLWLYRVSAQRGLLGGATTEGGSVYAWLRDTLHLPEPDALEAALGNRPPAEHGLTVLPFVAGERAPGWREDAKASLVGFTLSTDPIDIVQASLEAIAYRFALIYGRVAPHLDTNGDYQIIASGGGLLRSPAWLQIMADSLGQPVLTLEEEEVTSRGIALLALESLGVIQSPSDLPPATGKTYQPNQTHHTIHQEAINRQVELYNTLL